MVLLYCQKWLARLALFGGGRLALPISQATKRELMRRRQIEALRAAAGAWRDKDHPELKHGSARWVRKLRQESEKRFQKAIAR